MTRLSTDEIRAAAELIDPVFLHTPQFLSESLSEELGINAVCKIETLNPIRSFKGRGADFFLTRLGGGSLHLVCASAGNFGQGLAYAARKRKMPVDIFAAQSANPLKLERMRALGAKIHLAGKDFDEAKDAAKAYALRNQFRYVEDGRDKAISEGAGTIAVELLQFPAALDAIFVPVGNGALINGIGTWCKAFAPRVRVIGVCMKGAPSMEMSWRAKKVIHTNSTRTIADGIAVRVPAAEALQDLEYAVDEICLIEDEDLLQAMKLAIKTLGLVIEPAGAAGLAALMKFRDEWVGQNVATVFCGGNITEEQRRLWLG